jgi:hypothetical protein
MGCAGNGIVMNEHSCVRLDSAAGIHIIIEMEHRSRGMAVITLVISMVIAALLVVVALSIFTRRTSAGEDSVTGPIEKGRSIQCLAQRRGVETSLQLYRAEHGNYPAYLDDLTDLTGREFRCPATDTPYVYDQGAGKLVCPDHP